MHGTLNLLFNYFFPKRYNEEHLHLVFFNSEDNSSTNLIFRVHTLSVILKNILFEIKKNKTINVYVLGSPCTKFELIIIFFEKEINLNFIGNI